MEVLTTGDFIKNSGFTESQILVNLKEAEDGIAVTEVLRSHGINAATFYKWPYKYGGLEASEIKRVRELERQLSDYKNMVAELTRDKRVLESIIKKALAPTGKREAGDYLVGEEHFPYGWRARLLAWHALPITRNQLGGLKG